MSLTETHSHRRAALFDFAYAACSLAKKKSFNSGVPLTALLQYVVGTVAAPEHSVDAPRRIYGIALLSWRKSPAPTPPCTLARLRPRSSPSSPRTLRDRPQDLEVAGQESESPVAEYAQQQRSGETLPFAGFHSYSFNVALRRGHPPNTIFLHRRLEVHVRCLPLQIQSRLTRIDSTLRDE
jgi:hypothetical protein